MVEKSERRGRPVIVLKRDENGNHPFSFRLSKAELIAENIEAVKQFIAEEKKVNG